jgi:hypothetical protein
MPPLKRAYLIIIVAFACLIGGAVLGGLLSWRDDASSAAMIAYFLAIIGFTVGLIAGTCEIAIAKGYSPWLGLVLGLAVPLGLLIVEILPDRSEYSR